jgi:hypothetical protein
LAERPNVWHIIAQGGLDVYKMRPGNEEIRRRQKTKSEKLPLELTFSVFWLDRGNSACYTE